MKPLSHVQLFATPWTVAFQAPLSVGFSRQEYWSGLPFPSPEDLPFWETTKRVSGRDSSWRIPTSNHIENKVPIMYWNLKGKAKPVQNRLRENVGEYVVLWWRIIIVSKLRSNGRNCKADKNWQTQLYKNIKLFAANMIDKGGKGMFSCCWLGV